MAACRQSLPKWERLTQAFYDWEIRGRGWLVFDEPVDLEPPFRPFAHMRQLPGPVVDEGRKHTVFSALGEGIVSFFKSPEPKQPEFDLSIFDEPDPVYVDQDIPIVEFVVSLPKDLTISKDVMEGLLLLVGTLDHPLSFEIVGTSEGVTVQFACRESDAWHFKEALSAYVPSASVTERESQLEEIWHGASLDDVILHIGLSEEFMLPLRTVQRFDVDPLIGVVAGLSNLKCDELGVLQVLFQPVQHSWAPSIMRSVMDSKGGSFFLDAPQMVPAAKEKVSKPLFAAVIRVATKAGDFDRAWNINKAVGGSLARFTEPDGNALGPLDDEHYPLLDIEHDFLNRVSRRPGCLLNSNELISLVHLPGASVQIRRDDGRTKPPPSVTFGHTTALGENHHQGIDSSVSLSTEQRLRHMHVVGASGTGKSTFLLNTIRQDIENGDGCAVLDPHGDLIDEILGHVPEHRLNDVVLFDPSDEAYPVGFNILEAHSEVEKNLLASDLGAVFKRLSTSWGDQMTAVLGNAILAFLEHEDGGTLISLRRFLVDQEYRESFLEGVQDQEVVYFWERVFPGLSGKPQGSILTRLDTFLRPKLIRHMVAQKSTRLDFGSMMNDGKIFLAKLSQGAVGEENASLLGALLVSKFQQLAIARQEIEKAERRPFFLYIDEFHNFITPSMAAILSGTRKYGLGLCLAHQDLKQLAKQSDVASSVISNPYTRVCFRLGDDDAKKLQDGFSFFTADDLQNLDIGEAICRVGQAKFDFNVRTLPPVEVDAEVAESRQLAIVEHTRVSYATPRDEVVALLDEERPKAKPRRAKKPTNEKPVFDQSEVGERIEEPKPEPPKSKAASKPKPKPDLPPLGRGGAKHKYLQQFIKQLGEQRGFKSTIKEPTDDGERVDVSLRQGDVSIACEISVTTDAKHELGNIEKCLKAGYDKIAVVAEARKQLNAIKKQAASLPKEQTDCLLFLIPDELVQHLDEIAAQNTSTEQTVRGYKVKVNRRATRDAADRRGVVAKVVARSLRGLDKEK